jgi:hypothetical protein
VAFDHDCEIAISSWTHTPYRFQEEVGTLANYGLPAICIQSIYLMIQKKIIQSRVIYNLYKEILITTDEYLRSQNVSEKIRSELLGILEKKLEFNPKTMLIDICPSESDYQLFHSRFFSLDPQLSSEVIKKGHQKALEVLRAIKT